METNNYSRTWWEHSSECNVLSVNLRGLLFPSLAACPGGVLVHQSASPYRNRMAPAVWDILARTRLTEHLPSPIAQLYTKRSCGDPILNALRDIIFGEHFFLCSKWLLLNAMCPKLISGVIRRNLEVCNWEIVLHLISVCTQMKYSSQVCKLCTTYCVNDFQGKFHPLIEQNNLTLLYFISKQMATFELLTLIWFKSILSKFHDWSVQRTTYYQCSELHFQ